MWRRGHASDAAGRTARARSNAAGFHGNCGSLYQSRSTYEESDAGHAHRVAPERGVIGDRVDVRRPAVGCGASGDDETLADSVADAASNLVDVELVHDARAVAFTRLHRDTQQRGGLLRCLPLREQTDHSARPGAP